MPVPAADGEEVTPPAPKIRKLKAAAKLRGGEVPEVPETPAEEPTAETPAARPSNQILSLNGKYYVQHPETGELIELPGPSRGPVDPIITRMPAPPPPKKKKTSTGEKISRGIGTAAALAALAAGTYYGYKGLKSAHAADKKAAALASAPQSVFLAGYDRTLFNSKGQSKPARPPPPGMTGKGIQSEEEEAPAPLKVAKMRGGGVRKAELALATQKTVRDLRALGLEKAGRRARPSEAAVAKARDSLVRAGFGGSRGKALEGVLDTQILDSPEFHARVASVQRSLARANPETKKAAREHGEQLLRVLKPRSTKFSNRARLAAVAAVLALDSEAVDTRATKLAGRLRKNRAALTEKYA